MNYSKTTRQQGCETRENILQAIKAYIIRHGYPPTVREICEMTGLKSTSTVQHHLERMMKNGDIETDAGNAKSRAIRVPGMQITFTRTSTMNGYKDMEGCE